MLEIIINIKYWFFFLLFFAIYIYYDYKKYITNLEKTEQERLVSFRKIKKEAENLITKNNNKNVT